MPIKFKDGGGEGWWHEIKGSKAVANSWPWPTTSSFKSVSLPSYLLFLKISQLIHCMGDEGLSTNCMKTALKLTRQFLIIGQPIMWLAGCVSIKNKTRRNRIEFFCGTKNLYLLSGETDVIQIMKLYQIVESPSLSSPSSFILTELLRGKKD